MFEWEAGFGYFLSSSMMKTTNAIKWELPKWSFFMVFLVTLLLKFMTNFYSFLGTCFCIIFMSVFPQGGLPLSCSSTHERGITPSWPFCRIISYVLLELHMKEGLWYQDPSSVFCRGRQKGLGKECGSLCRLRQKLYIWTRKAVSLWNRQIFTDNAANFYFSLISNS